MLFTCLYRSSSQNCDQFSDFYKDFSILLSNINDHRPSCSVIVGHFNAKCSKWYRLDKKDAVSETLQTYTTTSGYSKLIDKPTHCVNGSSSCIDLIFTSNTSLVTDFGVNPRLYKTCHHNLIFGKINFNIPLLPPFYRDIWDYKRAIVEIAQKAITNFNWKQAFSNSSVNENVRLFGDTLKNIFSNYIPNRRIKIDYSKPKWMTHKTFTALRKRSKLSKKYYANPSMVNKKELNSYSKYYTEIITDTKDKFLNRPSVKLDDANASAKSYWSTINNFLNKKKYPAIPPLLFNGTLVSDSKEKANLFNSYFSSQCTPIDTFSKRPVFA